jgi:AcrR family transcriptional regulator
MDIEKDERREHVAPTELEPCGLRQMGAAASRMGSGRRGEIIDATMRLIVSGGVAAVSTRKIAREAAVNLATLHYLFSSKDDLLLAVLDAATSAIIAELVLEVHPGGGLHAALAESFAALCALLDRAPGLPVVRCEVLLYTGRRLAQPAGARQQQRFLEALQVCYRVAGAQGELALIGYDDLASVVSSSIDGLALHTAAGMPRPEQVATRAHVLRALLTLVPGPPTGPQACDDSTTTTGFLTVVETSHAGTGREQYGQ